MTKERRMITIRAGDGVNVEIPLFATEGSRLLRYAVSSLHDDDVEHQQQHCSGDDNTAVVVIPLDRVHSRELNAVVEFLIHYHKERMIPIVDPLEGDHGSGSGSGDAMTDVVKPTFAENVPQQLYRDYVDNLGQDMDLLYAVRNAAYYMDIRPLFLLVNVWLVFQMAGKSEEEIRDLLRLPEPTQVELDELYAIHPWIQELDRLNLEEEANQQRAQ